MFWKRSDIINTTPKWHFRDTSAFDSGGRINDGINNDLFIDKG